MAVHDRVRRHGGRGIDEAAEIEERANAARYDEATLAAIDDDATRWSRRRDGGLSIGDIATGDHIGPMVKGPLTVTDREVNDALDELTAESGTLTRTLLGAGDGEGEAAAVPSAHGRGWLHATPWARLEHE